MGDSAAVSGETSSTSFVKISGDKFILNDAVYTVVGYFHDRLRMELFMSDFRNSYWIGLTGLSSANMHAAFADIPKAGGTTVWTWLELSATLSIHYNFSSYFIAGVSTK